MFQKLSNVMVAALLLGTVFLAIAPTAEAQQQGNLVVSITPPNEAVKPLRGALNVQGKIDFQGDPSATGQITGIPVTYTISKKPAWASVVVSPGSDVIPVSAGASQTVSGSKTFSISITASDQAPAFQSEEIEITATTNPGTGGNAVNAKSSFPIYADFFSIIDVQLAESVKVERPQTPTIFPLKVTNLGNANTKVSFEVVSAAEGLNVPTPPPITLQSKQAGGNQITSDVSLQIQTPYRNGYMNEVGVVTYKITSAYALDPKLKGDENTVSVLITTRGFYVPGLSPILLVGLLGLAAVLARRTRE